jgi:hypothetical protein
MFKGTVESDFLKLVPSDKINKESLVDFTASDWVTIRNSLIEYIKAVYPLDYTNFSESDFGMMLIELMAGIGHIQSIKADYLASENYIRTARSRESVKKLMELIGVRMKGPISAAGNGKITITGAPSVSGPTPILTVEILPENRVFTLTSPLDGLPVSYTLYKINNQGFIDVDSTINSLTLDATYTDETTIILSSLVVLEGALVTESGVFSSPESIKTITLTQSPYVEKSCQVYIEGNVLTAGSYKEEENIYFASGSNDKIFQISTDNNFNAKVIFGDSSFGMSPSIGDTFTVTYRVGGGERGNLPKEAINVPIQLLGNFDETEDPLSLDGVFENTTECIGGTEAETVSHAKKYAPYTFRRQDRLVTLQDYKSFTNSFMSSYGSIGKANAVVRKAYSSANIIDVFVLEKASNLQLKAATPEFKRQLLLAMADKKMLTDEPVIVDGLIRTLDLSIVIYCDEKFKKKQDEIISKARLNILNFFNVDNMDFGTGFIPQELTRSLTSIDEIRYSEVINVKERIPVNHNEIIQLNNLSINIEFL